MTPAIQPSQAAGEAAQAMCDLFASVGAVAFDVTYTDLAGALVSYRRGIRSDALRRWLPGMVAWAAAQRLNLIIRPVATGAILIQLDDLNGEAMDRLRPVAFLGLETSPGNFQAWLAIPAEDADRDLARRLRRGVGADDSASGATRVAGSLNFKRKYAPNFPRVGIVHSDPGRVTSAAELEALGIGRPAGSVHRHPRSAAARQAWPSYQRCVDGAKPRRDGNGSDISRADFTWCMIAADWGWTVEEVAARLMELSRKAQENGQAYAVRTAQNAAEVVRRRAAS